VTVKWTFLLNSDLAVLALVIDEQTSSGCEGLIYKCCIVLVVIIV